MTAKKSFEVLATIAAMVLFCIACLPLVSAATPYNAYFLGNDQIVGYSSDHITLSNGTMILIDTTNITKYVHSINKKEVYQDSAYLSYSNTNYAINSINLSDKFPVWDPKNTTRITQGDCVTLGKTVDIGGIGWYTGHIAYYGRYYTEYSNDYGQNMVALKKVDAWNLTTFYIDPEYFYQYPGWWYTYDDYQDNATTTQSNDRLFYISDNCGIQNLQIPKPVTINLTELDERKERNLWELPEKREQGIDFIVSRNLTSNISAPENTRLWIFGQSDSVYDRTNLKNSTELPQNTTANWQSGLYNFIYTRPDGNGIFDQEYNINTKTITSPFVNTKPEYIGDLQPRLVYIKLLSLISGSYQKNYTHLRVDIQDPMIEVVKLDSWQGWDNASYITMAGYTNANPGNTLTIEMDRGKMGAKESAKRTWVVTVWGNMSAYRIWNTSFMLDIQNENPGPHTMTVTSNSGGSITGSFYIYREPAAHYIPENYIQYVNNSPFIPPVIQTVTIPVPGPTKIVYVEVPPSQESVNAGQTAALMELVRLIGECIGGAIIGFLIIRYVIRSMRRRKWLTR